MTVQETAASIERKLSYISDRLAPIDNSLFIQLGDAWVYPYPLRSSIAIEIDGRTYTRNDHENAVVNLDLSEQLRLYELAQSRLGLKLRHPSLKENLEAAYLPETKLYKGNVLKYFWINNGILSKKEGQKIDIRKVIGVKFVDEPASNSARQIIQDAEGREFPTIQTEGTVLRRRYVVEPTLNQPPLQTELPTILFDYFDNFEGLTPIDADLKKSGRGYWWGTYFDNEDLSAVRSYWDSGERRLVADSNWPLYRYDYGALGVWTDENPKK